MLLLLSEKNILVKITVPIKNLGYCFRKVCLHPIKYKRCPAAATAAAATATPSHGG